MKTFKTKRKAINGSDSVMWDFTTSFEYHISNFALLEDKYLTLRVKLSKNELLGTKKEPNCNPKTRMY
jgi:hypothetical protein